MFLFNMIFTHFTEGGGPCGSSHWHAGSGTLSAGKQAVLFPSPLSADSGLVSSLFP